MKNGFVLSEDTMDSTSALRPAQSSSRHRSDNRDDEEPLHVGTDKKAISGGAGAPVRKSSIINAKLEGTKEENAWSTYKYEWLWCRIRDGFHSLKHVHWKNKRAPPGKAYTPTEVEHFANVLTHGIWIIPALFAGLQLLWRSDSNIQKWAATVYGSCLTLLFAVSTFFHCVHYSNRNRNLKDVLHRCDRAMIYVFIAGSYYPWLTLAVQSNTSWMVWLLAGGGILYQQIFHERYKCLETCLYLVMGIGPSLVFGVGHHLEGVNELQVGGIIYIIGICFFKADGKIPCAHAIWHLFVVLAAMTHYYAILKYLYTN